MENLTRAFRQFYFTEHNNNPPTFLQVIGWTYKAEVESTIRRYVYVRKVPLIIDNGLSGGSWSFDYNIIENYKTDIPEPLKTNVPGLVTGNAILIDGADFIRYGGVTVPRVEM